MIAEGQALLGRVVSEDADTLMVEVRKDGRRTFSEGETFYLLSFLTPAATGDGYEAHRPWDAT